MTEGGSQVIKVVDEETFKDIQTKDGEYLNTWYEILPESVVNGTAAPGSVPLIIGFAGTNDDPLQFAEELGLIHLTEVEDVAVVSPGHEGIFETLDGTDGVEYETQPKLIAYMLEKYPALDPHPRLCHRLLPRRPHHAEGRHGCAGNPGCRRAHGCQPVHHHRGTGAAPGRDEDPPSCS